MEIKKKFKVIDLVLTPKTLEKFEVMENRRKITDSMVSRIHSVLEKGSNPLGILIVNERKGKFRLIDGNHRIEAVKRFYFSKESNKPKGIECVLRVYSNLTDEEERQIYSEEAKRINQTHEDLLSMYRDTIPIWKIFNESKNNFPCKVSIYNQVDSLKFRTIIDSLFTISGEMRNSYVPRYLNRNSIITFSRGLGQTHFLLMKRFVTIFQGVFGNVGKQNPYTRPQFFLALFDVFMKNFHTKPDDKIKERFSLLKGKSDILLYLDMHGREANQRMREIIIGYMNKGKHSEKNLII